MNNYTIYLIQNNINNKRYIGSSINGKKRMYNHLWLLKNNCHSNKLLQNDFNLFGEENFTISLICNVYNEKMLRELERKYILDYQTYNEYNIGKF
jgi:group I intron endonuclease